MTTGLPFHVRVLADGEMENTLQAKLAERPLHALGE
jgi:hypothetical protein